MKNVLIFDGTCPACRAYTKGFVWMGLLSKEERQSSCTLQHPDLLAHVDKERARHEIPLIDVSTGQTRYGVDALLAVMAIKFPRFSEFIRGSFWYTISRGLYAFISSNRRIIAPPKPGRWELMDLQPDFQATPRALFVGLLLALICLVHPLVLGWVNWYLLAVMCIQVGVVGLLTVSERATNKLETILDYTAHLSISIVVGGLVKFIGFGLGQDWLVVVGSALTIGLVFIRTNLQGISLWTSVLFAIIYLLIQ